MPGPVTPLGWSVWSPAGELGGRVPFYAMGAIPKALLGLPERPEDRILNVFYGRVGAAGRLHVRDGRPRAGHVRRGARQPGLRVRARQFREPPSKRRYPVIAAKFPAAFVRVPSSIRKARAETEPWWTAEVARTPTLDLAGARAQLQAGIDRFTTNLSLQATAIVCGIQIAFEQLSLLAAKAGVDHARR